MRAKVPHPATARELLRVLHISRDDGATFKRLLRHLVNDGSLVQIKGNRYGLPDRMDLVVGRLDGHPSGFGFVTPERPIEGLTRDIYVAAHNLQEALHGDRVVTRIERYRDDGRAEGRIVQVLERATSTIVGRFEVDVSGLGFVSPFDKRLAVDVQIPRADTHGAAPGQMVTVEVTRWPTPTRGPLGRIVEVLGDVNDPGVDTEIILRKHNIPDEHGVEAVEEARRIGKTIRDRDLKGRTDFRDRKVVTIDGETAKDFDDAISIETLPNGHFWLGVHIADVAHYVHEGGALDTEAYERATSVYFPERAVHMFPPELATGLCSLNPHVDRLVQSCLMEVSPRGEVVRYEMHDGIIRSDERMTYTAVNAILTDRDPQTIAKYAPLVPMFELMGQLFEILNARRRGRGSVDFDLPEALVVLDEKGFIEDIIASERNVAHRLIEEFMLLANETVAGHLESRGMPALYRIHERPDPLKVLQFEEFISAFGLSLGAPEGAVTPMHFQKLVGKIRGLPSERPIAFLMLRTMQKARYDPINLGHFGLAAETYTHFTSPIRRYPDLVVHRLLRELRQTRVNDERKAELEEDLPEVGRHTSEMERRAAEAEREILQWKKVRFMADKVGDVFDGYITGVAAFGMFVELVDHYVEGLVHVSTMADDYYRFREQAHALFGENTKKLYRLGDPVRVQIIRVDMERRQIDLGLEDVLEKVRHDERSRGPSRTAARPKKDQRKGTPQERRKRKNQRPGKFERKKSKKAK
ncbi:MAG: ribonuclease R [Acidobacteria bacterium RIFCSPLOWO2_12_FULL_67_14b]|nr:MAG: ribonuclease R [Acidobacteria bacterium RIFCSPLOWO2_12_FULL_67_14b]